MNKAQQYFDTVFLSRSPKLVTICGDKEDWVFASTIQAGITLVAESFARDLRNATALEIHDLALNQLTKSLKFQLYRVLNPVFQANYDGFVLQCEKAQVVSRIRNSIEEEKLKRRFLQAMKDGGTGRLFDTNVLLRDVAISIIEDWLTNSFKMLQKLEQDQEMLDEILRVKPRKTDRASFGIKNLQIGLSDPHNQHQSVAIVELLSGYKVVYKPRSLEAEKSFYSWVEELNRSAKTIPDLYVPWIVSKGSYGWMEYIQPLSAISSEDKLVLYAKQFGALCALWYIVGGTDLHGENVVFGRKGVVLIDGETIFEADLYYHSMNKMSSKALKTGPDATLHTIASTQALSALISDMNVEKEKLFQIGGISEFKKMFIMASLRKKAQSSIDWRLLTDVVCESIGSTLRFFRTYNQKQVTSEIIKHFSGGLSARIILRPTSSYVSMLSNLSMNFSAIRKRERAARYIRNQLAVASRPHDGFPRVKLKNSEVEQLLNFDIPYFRRKIGEQIVYDHTGTECQLPKNTDFLSLKWRLKFLNQAAFIEDEMQLAKTTLDPDSTLSSYTQVRTDDKRYVQHFATGSSLQSFLELARKDHVLALAELADDIMQEIRLANNGIHAFRAVSFTQYKDCMILTPSSYSLFVGIAGKLLFLALYGKIMQRNDVQEFVADQINFFIELGNNPAYVKTGGIGGLASGFQSLLYVIKCCEQLGIPLNSLGKSHLQVAVPHATTAKNYDFIGSTPGNLLIAEMFKERLPDENMRKWAKKLKGFMKQLERNWDSISDVKRVGLAHGALGTCLAASRLHRLGADDPELQALTSRLIDLEAIAAKNSSIIGNTYGWCYGATGRALAYYQASSYLGRPELLDEALTLTSISSKTVRFSNHTLCCGSLGYVAANFYIRDKINTQNDQGLKLTKLFKFYENPNALLDYSLDKDNMPYGLFYGLAGFGIVMLYCVEPDVVPAVWLFEAGK